MIATSPLLNSRIQATPEAPSSLGRFLILLASGFLVLLPISAAAVGSRLPNQDPEAIARGNAFAATADNPSAIYYNPAGITQLKGQNFDVGLYLVSAGIKYESPNGRVFKANSDFQPVPQIYYVDSLKNCPLSFGMGIYAPFGLAMDWGNNTSFRTLAEKGKLLYASVNPVLAWQILPSLSVGGGPTINYSKVDLKKGIGFLPNDQFKFNGDDLDLGFNAGVRWQPHPKWAAGVNYRSSTLMNYRGESELSPFSGPTATSAKLQFPQSVAAGISFRPTEDWNLEVDVDWTDWESVKQVVFKGTAAGDQVFPLNYRSSFMYELGVTRQLGRGYFISAGYFYSENSSPDKNFNPIVPDADLHLGSIGFGRRGKRWNWAAAYHFGYNAGREVKNNQSISAIGETANGIYRIFNQAFTVSTTFKF